MVEVVATDEFIAWYVDLADGDAEAVTEAVDVLQSMGLGLGYPQASAIKGSKYALRELRIQSSGRPLRVVYAFDPRRNAVLIIGGDKTGDGRFYERIIRTAEAIWKQYLEETRS